MLDNIKYILASVTIVAAIFLGINLYKSYQFDTQELPLELQQKLYQKKFELIRLVKQNYGVDLDIPIIISNELPRRYYGLARSGVNGDIKIFLNKDAFRDSSEYMIDDVLPHEYAHALMFYLGDYNKAHGGHTDKWRQACKKLQGKMCNRYVDKDEVIREKMFR